MKSSEIKQLIISSLDPEADTKEIAGKLEAEGVSFSFNQGFSAKISARLFSPVMIVNREPEFVRNLSFVFKRIALTGAAAIIILLISIFLSEGSVSLNSFLGLANGADESILYILAGN
jgi:hypothetical protein